VSVKDKGKGYKKQILHRCALQDGNLQKAVKDNLQKLVKDNLQKPVKDNLQKPVKDDKYKLSYLKHKRRVEGEAPGLLEDADLYQRLFGSPAEDGQEAGVVVGPGL
jgi:hypothetical protein